MADRYTQTILTIIALCLMTLVVLALRPLRVELADQWKPCGIERNEACYVQILPQHP